MQPNARARVRSAPRHGQFNREDLCAENADRGSYLVDRSVVLQKCLKHWGDPAQCDFRRSPRTLQPSSLASSCSSSSSLLPPFLLGSPGRPRAPSGRRAWPLFLPSFGPLDHWRKFRFAVLAPRRRSAARATVSGGGRSIRGCLGWREADHFSTSLVHW